MLVPGTLMLLAAGEAAALPRPGARVAPARAETLDERHVVVQPPAGHATIVIYEDKRSRHQNRALEEELQHAGRDPAVRARVAVFAVADVRAYRHWPARAIARLILRGEQRHTAAPILLDFEGEVARAYGVVAGRSTVVVIGRDGRVAFAAAGPLDAAARRRVIELLLK